jgi:glycosyltransferase involved in cell wall biosynthesis
MNIGINVINSNETLRGTDRYATELIYHLSKIDRENNYYIFFARWQKFYFENKSLSNVQFVRTVPPKNNTLRAIWSAFIFPQIAKRYKLDIVHYSNPVPIAKKICQTVVTVHDVAEFIKPEKYGHIKSFAKRVFVKLSLRSSDYVITVSHSSEKILKNVLPSYLEFIGVTLEGVTIAQNEAYRGCQYIYDKYKLPQHYVLYVGVIEKTKQVESIVRAFSHLEDFLKDRYSIVIVGKKGNAYSKLMSVIRECGLYKKCFMLGHIPESDLACVYKNASAFVFPSLVEGFGLPVLEAMGHGVPVIASDIPPISEVAGDSAVLIDPHDIRALKDAMRQVLLDATLRRELISKGLARIKKFSWEAMARQTLSVYVGLLRHNNGPVH